MTEALVIDGKAAAASLRARVKAGVNELVGRGGPAPGLAVALVGEDPASQVYVRNKSKAAIEAGMVPFDHPLPAEVTESDLLAVIRELNARPDVHGILVQLPLPAHIRPGAILQAIDPAKDVDGFHPYNAGRLATGSPTVAPCTPLGCLMLLRQHHGSLSGQRAIVIGRSTIVGRPMGLLLLNADCTVTLAHSRTRDLPDECRRADIVVSAVGSPGLIRANWLRPGATVIDVGIVRVPSEDPAKTRLVGDVRFQEASSVAGAITPVPGGVGPMTIACLLLNTLAAACRSVGLPPPAEALP